MLTCAIIFGLCCLAICLSIPLGKAIIYVVYRITGGKKSLAAWSKNWKLY